MLFACDCSARVCISFISLFAAAAPLEAFYDAGAPIIFLVALLTLTAFYCYSIELNCVKVQEPEAEENDVQSTVPHD